MPEILGNIIISNNLVGQDVIFSNADIYLGNGFELVDPATIKSFTDSGPLKINVEMKTESYYTSKLLPEIPRGS